MNDRPGDDPPGSIRFTLEEALALLADLEDGWDGLWGANVLTVVAAIEDQIDLLSRRLGLGSSEGGDVDE